MAQRRIKTVDDIVLKKCEICLVNDIPPYNRNGEPITRQSKYDEKKTCGPECFRIAQQTSITGGCRYKRSLRAEPEVVLTAVDLWLRGAHG
jgi:hypothetical protein